jgi:ABC-type protease/lipase transport system fused ATPase/permease subunit
MTPRVPANATRVGDLLKRCHPEMAAALVFSLTVNILMLTSSVYMMQVYDRVLASGSAATLGYLTLIAVGALLILALLDAVRARLLGRVGTWLEAILGPVVLRRGFDAALADESYRTEALRDLGTIRGFLVGPGHPGSARRAVAAGVCRHDLSAASAARSCGGRRCSESDRVGPDQ